MTKYFDSHTHSKISFDASISIQESCRQALAQGVDGLVFTEHVELELPGVGDCYPADGYDQEIASARLFFPTLYLGQGIEIDLNCNRSDELRTIAADPKWDFLLGAWHQADGISICNGSFSLNKTPAEAYQEYWHKQYQVLKSEDYFDVLAHIDLLRRDSSLVDFGFPYADYALLIDDILKLLIERGQGIEINTGGLRYAFGACHPHPDILKRYRQLGGEIITCGSDCHTIKSACSGLKEGYQHLKEAGFDYVCLFEKRKPQFIKI